MKNILKTTENLEFYNKEGVKVYEFGAGMCGYSFEYTRNKNGNILTYKNSEGYSFERTIDENGNELTFKDSDKYSYEKTYDENGNQLTFRDSDGNERGFEIPEFTMEELTQKLGNFKLIK